MTEKEPEKISDDMVGRSMPCTCGTIIDEMLVNGMDDELRIRPISKDEIPPAAEEPKQPAAPGNPGGNTTP